MRIVKCDDEGLEAVAEILVAGGTAIVPTDTVYGLAAHPDFPAAVEKLYSIKGRVGNKPIAVLASGFEAAAAFVGGLDGEAAELARQNWPGALTIVTRGEGLRVPDCEWTRRLISRCGGALRVTSANRSGEPPALDFAVAAALEGPDIAADGGRSPGGRASRVVRVLPSGGTEILRG